MRVSQPARRGARSEKPSLSHEFALRAYTAATASTGAASSKCVNAKHLSSRVIACSVNVRRLAAIDMYGATGSARRRRIILAEFAVGVIGAVGIGLGVLAHGS